MAGLSPFRDLLASPGFVVLDGGLATELEALGFDLGGGLWSARLLAEAPAAIAEVHRRYLHAGADCITSASYQASVPGFVRCGYAPRQAGKMLERSTQIALEARDRFWPAGKDRPDGVLQTRRPLVAASIGPYGAFLADGSEYHGRYGITARELRRFHRDRFNRLAASGADLLAIETIPSMLEAQVLLELLDEHPSVLAWLSFCCSGPSQLCDGTSFDDVVSRLGSHPRLVALGVNCTAPNHLPALMESIRARTELAVVAYPNSGEAYHAESGTWQGERDPMEFGRLAVRLKRAGANLIGGCCRTGPAHIGQVLQALTLAQ